MRGGATLCTELWAGQWQTPGIPALFVNPQNSGILNAVTGQKQAYLQEAQWLGRQVHAVKGMACLGEPPVTGPAPGKSG